MANMGRPLPDNILETLVSYMKNYSKTQIRMTPSTGSTAVKAGDTTVFKLPSAKVVDLATLRFNLHCATNGTNGTNGAADEVVGLPRHISSMISQFEVWCNGQSVMNIPRYNHIYNIVRDYSGDHQKYQSKLFNNADPSVDYVTNDAGVITKYNTYTNTTVAVVNQFSKDYCIDDFIGFFDFSEGNRQSFFNTNLVGDFEIHITWASDKVLWVKDGAAITPTYTITNLIGWIDAIEFKDDAFVNALDSKINAVGPDGKAVGVHRIPFKNYKSYTTSDTIENAETTIRVVENTNSLDKLIFTYLDASRNTTGTLQLGDQNDILTTTPSAAAGDTQNIANAVIAAKVPKAFFNYEYLKATKNPYLLNSSKHFRRNGLGLGYDTATRTKSALIQFELDSQDLHNPMDIASVYQETLKAFELNYNNINRANPGIQNFNTWLRDFFVAAYSVSHVGGKNRGYLISGVDTQATAINIAVKVTNKQNADNAAKSATPMLITEMTSELLIGGGRSVSIRP